MDTTIPGDEYTIEQQAAIKALQRLLPAMKPDMRSGLHHLFFWRYCEACGYEQNERPGEWCQCRNDE